MRERAAMTIPAASKPPYVRYFPADHLHLPHWTESQAVVSTAEATWALFWVTGAAAVVTLLAVVAALIVPVLNRAAHRAEARALRRDVDRRALDEMRRARELMAEVRADLKTHAFVKDNTLWTYTNRTAVIRRLLEKYLGAGEGTGELDRLEMQTVQALFEVDTACRRCRTGGEWHAEGERYKALGTVERAQERAKEVFDYLDAHP